jgi:hypothetical protein
VTKGKTGRRIKLGLDPETLIALYLAAPNDTNGNPRRGWILLQAGRILGWVDEGYQGEEALKRAISGKPVLRIPRVNVTATEWKLWRNLGMGREGWGEPIYVERQRLRSRRIKIPRPIQET